MGHMKSPPQTRARLVGHCTEVEGTFINHIHNELGNYIPCRAYELVLAQNVEPRNRVLAINIRSSTRGRSTCHRFPAKPRTGT